MARSILKDRSYNPGWVRDFYDQAGRWWGLDEDTGLFDAERVRTVETELGDGPLKVLDLGAGTMKTPLAFAEEGHSVVAVELSETRALMGLSLMQDSHRKLVQVIIGDYYTDALGGGYDAVCCWDGFGVGCDKDQRRLMRRIAHEWLKDGGLAFIEVFNTYFLSRLDGTEEKLDKIEGVAESVDMTRRARFDPVNCRWIDEWEPVADKKAALSQAVRCYTPADFLLLTEGTGLELVFFSYAGEKVAPGEIPVIDSPIKQAYEYLAVLRKA